MFNQFSFQSKLDKFYGNQQKLTGITDVDSFKVEGLKHKKEDYENSRKEKNELSKTSLFTKSNLLSKQLEKPSTYTQLL